jgi:hypothetical protein
MSIVPRARRRDVVGRGALAVLFAACAGREPKVPDSPGFELQWTGADTGRMAGRASAEWCGALKVLEINGVAGDTGIAIALYPRDSVRPDSYPVVRPEQADSVPPASAVALRYFAETAVKGYQGDSGRVLLNVSAAGSLSGRFSAALKSASDGSRLHAAGTFRNLRVLPATRGCIARPRRQPADTGVH